MPLFDAIKKILGFTPQERRDESTAWCDALLAQMDGSTPVADVAKVLRVKWLERAFDEEGVRQRLTSQIVPRFKEKYPRLAELADVFEGAFALKDREFYSDELYRRAMAFRGKKMHWPVEANLFLSNYHLIHGFQTQGYWFLLRELDGDAGPFMAVQLHNRHRLYAALLHNSALEDGDDALGRYDRVTAVELAREHALMAQARAEGLSGRLGSVVGEIVAGPCVAALKTRTDDLARSVERLLRDRAVEAGPDFAAIARCQSPGPHSMRDQVMAVARNAIIEARCRQSDERFDAIDRKAEGQRLLEFGEHIDQIQANYDGYLPLIELTAEIHEREGRHQAAAEVFQRLCRKRPGWSYFAYRAGRSLRAAGDPSASRYFIHASRRDESRWRDEIAAARAGVIAYEFEAAALREVFPERRAECAGMLADRLEGLWAKASGPRWDIVTAAALALRIAHLRHLAFEEATRQSGETQAEGVINAYNRIGLDGAAAIGRRVPEDVFDPIPALGAGATAALQLEG